MQEDERFMKMALQEAKRAAKVNEVPVGAVIVKDGEVIAKGRNRREKTQNAIAHAEIVAIQRACKKLGTWRLEGCTMYVTLEPCPMCAGSLILSRIDRLVFGAYDPKGGSIVSCVRLYEQKGYNHYPEYTGGIMEEECGQILTQYFKEKRKKKTASV